MTDFPTSFDDWKLTEPEPSVYQCPLCHRDKEKWELSENHEWACVACVEENEVNETNEKEGTQP